MQLEATARTDTGPVREHNEDAFMVDAESGVFLVADGMGGHAAGEVASSIAIDTVSEVLLFSEDPEETRLEASLEEPAAMVLERMRYAMNQASMRIRQEAARNPHQAGMGTTLVALIIEEGIAYLAHVGDSRIYLLREQQLRLLTRDHTVVQQEIDAGRLTPELARIVPHKNMLTQSVGCHGPVEPDTAYQDVKPGDVFILCSDGLTDPLDDRALERISNGTPPDQLAEELTQQALTNGTEDNVTVVVVSVA